MYVHTSFLRVSPVPHIHSPATTQKIMGNVIIAMIPALIASTVIFGLRSLLIVVWTTACCVLFEYLWCLLRKQPQTVGDLSSVVTGMLLAYNMPPTVPLYLPIIGAIAAIIVTKEFFGGIGRNFANPAIVGRITLAVSFPSLMTTYSYPANGIDALSSATPLGVKAQELPMLTLLLGNHGGVIGETCAIALLIGLVWLLVTQVIEITIPAVYVAALAVLSLLAGNNPLQEILSGGLLLGAIFMATDYTTSPFTRKGKIVYSLGLAVITFLIRQFGNMNEGVSYAILLMNLTVPYINRLTRKTPLGGAVKS